MRREHRVASTLLQTKSELSHLWPFPVLRHSASYFHLPSVVKQVARIGFRLNGFSLGPENALYILTAWKMTRVGEVWFARIRRLPSSSSYAPHPSMRLRRERALRDTI